MIMIKSKVTFGIGSVIELMLYSSLENKIII